MTKALPKTQIEADRLERRRARRRRCDKARSAERRARGLEIRRLRHVRRARILELLRCGNILEAMMLGLCPLEVEDLPSLPVADGSTD